MRIPSHGVKDLIRIEQELSIRTRKNQRVAFGQYVCETDCGFPSMMYKMYFYSEIQLSF